MYIMAYVHDDPCTTYERRSNVHAEYAHTPVIAAACQVKDAISSLPGQAIDRARVRHAAMSMLSAEQEVWGRHT
jgi:hypothetical protein